MSSAPPPSEVDALYRRAVDDHNAGRLPTAAQHLLTIVTTWTGHVAAWRLLALTLRKLHHADAELCLSRALRDSPRDAELAAELGLLMLEGGRAAEAEAVVRDVVAAPGATALLHFVHAAALHGLDRLEDAAAGFYRALRLEPGFVSAANNLGVILSDLGRKEEAIGVLTRGLAVEPAERRSWNTLGTAYDGLDRFDEAFRSYRRSIRLRPDHSHAWNNAGGVLGAWKRQADAVACRRRAIALDPAYADAYSNLGSSMQELDRLAEAERLQHRALRLTPDHKAAHTALGLVYQTQGRFVEARERHERALDADPDYANAHANLGAMWIAWNQPEAAEPCLTRALELAPGMAEAHLNRGFLHLRRGALAEGWADYAWRFKAKGYEARRLSAPAWQGEDLAGRSILVLREQGVGDELMFSSCYHDLIGRAGRVIIECEPRFAALFARSFPGATVRAETVGDASGIDFHAVAGDLPAILRRRLADFTGTGGWLLPDAERAAAWRARLDALGPGLRVGICWRSQVMTTERRSAYTRLEDWAPVFAVPGVVLVNLQYDDCAAEIAAAEERFGVTIHRWADTDLKNDLDGVAALVTGLDLVIAPATAVIEMAGALGVPAWRLGAADWTQLGSRVRPWFPSMRSLMPHRGEAVADVLPRVASMLGRMARTARPAPLGADALFAAAVERYRAGDVAGAEAGARAALDRDVRHPAALHLMGVLARRRGADGEGADWFARAVRADPANGAAHAGLAAALRATGRGREALVTQAGAVRLAPDSVVERHRLVDLLVGEGRATEAVAAARVAVTLDPGSVAATAALGDRLGALDQVGEAVRVLRRAAKLAPVAAGVWTNLGNAEARVGRHAEAEACHRRAIDLDPGMAPAHANLGMLMRRLNRITEAELAYRAAVAADGAFAQAHYNLGLLLLERGEARAGWQEADWRFGTPQFAGQARRLPMRAWRGENIAGKRILVWREQGVGDEILFSSCLPDLIARAGHVVLECDRRLVGLFSRSFPLATVRAAGGEPRDADVHTPLGSLPRHLRSDLRRFPTAPGWLAPDAARATMWRERLAALGAGLRIGISWRSRLLTGERRAAYLTLDEWEPVLRLPGITVVNVQYGEVEAELRAVEQRLGITIHRWADLDLTDDFEGTAALLAGLDLVLSPAMSIGELAGALGVPVWRLGAPDWTWLGAGVRPWFPAMRLFQPRPGEALGDVPVRVAAALRALAPPERDDIGAVLEVAARHHREGRLEAAEPLYERVLRQDPDNATALHLSGLLAHQRGGGATAVRRIGRALERQPTLAAAWGSLGLALLALDRAAEAADALRRALALQPAAAAALTNLGNALEAVGRLAGAEVAHRRAAAVAPGVAAIHDNHGVALLRLGRAEAAEAAHRRALERAPDGADAAVNLGIALRRQGRRSAAAAAYGGALALAPGLGDAAANLGRLLRELGRNDEAARWTERALAVDPVSAVARFNRGVLRLAAGDLAGGWADYDARFQARALAGAARRIARPLWQGEPLADRRILVWDEQGVGDTLMFGSCLPDLAARAGHVVVECDARLVPLLARSLPGVTVRPPSAAPEDVDCHVAMGSLPRRLRHGLETFPVGAGWLRPDRGRLAGWQARLAALGTGLRVGVCWRSGLMSADRRDEYTGLDAWAPVFALPGLTLVTLQYDDCAAEVAEAESRYGVRLHEWPDLDRRNDFEGVAALMAALDLVITPATSVGELAASVGVPVWRFGGRGDWTALGTAARPWFPAMRVFHPRPGEALADALGGIAGELRRFMPTGKPTPEKSGH